MKKLLVTLAVSILFLFSLCITVSADSVVVEAENFDIKKNFTVSDQSDASAGSYITANANNAGDYRSEAELGDVEAEYKFTTNTTGNHTVYIRVANPSAFNGDSCWVTLDGVLHAVHFGSNSLDFQWKSLGITKLDAGEHTLRIYCREKEAKIDKVIITSNLLFMPTGKDDVPLKDTYDGSDLLTPVPTQKPPQEHPRLLVKKSDLPEIRANLNHPQNVDAYNRVLELAKSTQTGNQASYSAQLLEVMQAKAFLYMVNGDETKGREAVSMAMNHVRQYPKTIGFAYDGTTRFSGHVIFATSCVYDWCYDLFTTEQRTEFIQCCVDIATANFEGGYPIVEIPDVPSDAGHRVENPIFKDLLAFSIAVYDEDPFHYNDVLGVLQANYFTWRNDLYPSGWNPQGVSTYGTFRTTFEMFCAYMLDVIGQKPFVDDFQYFPYKSVYFRRPDGAYYTDADETRKVFDNTFVKNNHGVYFIAGNLYKDPVMKWYYYHDKVDTNYTDSGITGISAPMYLLMNDVDVELENSAKLPLTRYFGSPVGAMIARTSWEEGTDSSAAIAVMKPFENYYGGHAHREVGNFQFYYKGMLALDSGSYEAPSYTKDDGTVVEGSAWGSAHYSGYLTSPIAHNCLIIYAPANSKEIHYGGQRMQEGAKSSLGSFTDFKAGSHKTGEIVGYDFGPDKNEPEYSYIEGDLTYGYRDDRVKEYTRSYMFLNLFNDEIPAALIVYDRMESTNSNYKKSWLLHSQEEPIVDGDKITIRRTELHNNGRLIDTVLLPNNAQITKVGGEGKEYWNGTSNLEIYRQPVGDESGSWRIEISPDAQRTKDYFLNVMQVSDDENAPTPLNVTSNEQGQFVGVFIADRAVFMKKDSGVVSDSFTVSADGNGDISYIITNLAEGSWTVSGDSFADIQPVDSEHGVLRFRAPAGEYTLSHTAAAVSPKTFNIHQDSYISDETPVSIFVNDKSYDGNAIIKDGNIMISLEDIARMTNGTCDISGSYFSATGENGTISGEVGQTDVVINSEPATMAIASLMYEGNIYIPLRDAHAVFEFVADYNSLTHVLYISFKPDASVMVNGYLAENLYCYNKEGMISKGVTSGDNVCVNTTLTRMSGEDDNTEYKAILYAALYDGDELVKIDSHIGVFENYGDKAAYNLSLTVPEEPGDYKVCLYLWQFDDFKPLVFDSSSEKMAITGISLDGVWIDDFTSNGRMFDVKIPATDDLPHVVCESNSVGISVDVEYVKESVIITASTPTYEKEYIVNYSSDDAELTVMYDPAMNNGTETDVVELTYYGTLHQPSNLLTQNKDLTFEQALGDNINNFGEYASLAYYDKPYIYFENVPKELQGLKYYQFNFDKHRFANYNTFTVTSSKSVRLYFSSRSNVVNSEAKSVSLSSSLTMRRYDGVHTAIKDMPLNTLADDIYYVDLIVADGESEATIKLNAAHGDFIPVQLMYEFLD